MSLPNKSLALAAKLVSDAVKGHDTPACRAMFDHACKIERELDALALPVTDGVWEALRRYDDEASDLVCDITRVMGRAALATRGAGPREPITVDAIHAALKSGAIKAHALQAELKSVFGMPSAELTMQDIRLHVGEGKLTPQAVLNGANAAIRSAPPLPESPWKGMESATAYEMHPANRILGINEHGSQAVIGMHESRKQWEDGFGPFVPVKWMPLSPPWPNAHIAAAATRPATPDSQNGGEDAR